jgi:mannose/fructose/N-acetylgalactosamine-specific phosphotransferase system component IID
MGGYMFGIGAQELIIIAFPAVVVFCVIFMFGYFVGKHKGFKKGLDYMKNINKEQV